MGGGWSSSVWRLCSMGVGVSREWTSDECFLAFWGPAREQFERSLVVKAGNDRYSGEGEERNWPFSALLLARACSSYHSDERRAEWHHHFRLRHAPCGERLPNVIRSEERRVGKGCDWTCRSRRSQEH